MQVPPLQPFLDDIDKLKELFDPRERRLGENLLDTTADAVQQQMFTLCDPDGNKWKDLTKAYEAWKARVQPGKPIGQFFGLMAELTEIKGPPYRILRSRAEMSYGVTSKAKAEASWFQEGGGRSGKQPARPFYGIGARVVRMIEPILDRHFGDFKL